MAFKVTALQDVKIHVTTSTPHPKGLNNRPVKPIMRDKWLKLRKGEIRDGLWSVNGVAPECAPALTPEKLGGKSGPLLVPGPFEHDQLPADILGLYRLEDSVTAQNTGRFPARQ